MDKYIEIQLEKDKESYQRVLQGWINTIDRQMLLKNKKVKLLFHGERELCKCEKRVVNCRCYSVLPEKLIKDFLEDHYHREVKEFVREVTIRNNYGGCVGATFYDMTCHVVFGLTYEEKVAEAEEELQRCQSKLKKLRQV